MALLHPSMVTGLVPFPETAFRFLEAVDNPWSVCRACHTRAHGKPYAIPPFATCGVGRLQDLRQILIFYQARGDMLKAVRVLHGKRDFKRILKTKPAEQ